MKLDDVPQLTKEDLAQVRPRIEDVEKIKDPIKKLKASDKAILMLKAQTERMTTLRRELVFELHDEQGYTDNQIAEVLGVSSARVRQLVLKERANRGAPNRREFRGGKQADPTPELLRRLREQDPKEYERISKRLAKATASA